MKNGRILVLDLFAGPGGLGEGFASCISPDGNHPFKIGVSVEKDPGAHKTLTTRAFSGKSEMMSKVLKIITAMFAESLPGKNYLISIRNRQRML